MVRDRAYDVSELGLSYFLRTMDFDDPPFLAIPIFPVRSFRHSAIYINVDSGIKTPADLAGKTIGEFAMYGHDAGVWPKGILSDDVTNTPQADLGEMLCSTRTSSFPGSWKRSLAPVLSLRTEGAPYLAWFWRDVGIDGRRRESAGCAGGLPLREGE